MSPLIVIGCPRSGTSVVARLLQEYFGVMMDEGHIKKDAHNPDGYYEDRCLININARAIKRWVIGTNNSQRIDQQWAVEFGEWVAYRNGKYKQWGFKDPRMIGFINWVKGFFETPTFIYTLRSKSQIVKSQSEKLGFDPSIAALGVDAYKRMIKEHLFDCKLNRIDLSIHVPEQILLKRLKKILNGCCTNR